MKRNNGITLITLVITIVVAIILSATIIISYSSISKSVLKKEFAKEIYTIQKAVEEYNFRNDKYPAKDRVNILVSSLDVDSREVFKDEPGYSSGGIVLFEVDLYESNIGTINRGAKKTGDTDVYLVSITTGKVYYLKGEKIDSKVYYTLTDDLKKEIGLN